MNTRSIQFRLIVWYSCLVAAVLLAFASYTYQRVSQQLYTNREHTLELRAYQIAANVLTHTTQPATVATRIHEVYSPEANNRFIRILNQDHTTLYVSDMPEDGHFDPASVPILKNDIPRSRIEALSNDTSMLVIAAPAEIEGKTYLIEMGILIDEIEQTMQSLLLTLIYSLPIVILIVSTGGFMLVKRALQPVEDMRATAQKITFGNLSNRLPSIHTGDALEHLSVTLNQMLSRLEAAYEQASRFSADASHELRTPLTIMRGELEALAREPSLPVGIQERIGSVLEETEHLSHITESLFAISRLDAGSARMENHLCDLAALAKSTAEQIVLLAEEKNIALKIEVQSAPVLGDAARLKQVVINLLDNAIKYTHREGHIALSVEAISSHAVLEVTDDGIGIPAQALPYVFERFYRTDKARSREIGGAGLGLSIVRAIVQAHGGQVEIESQEGQGTRCRVTLPLAESGV